MVISAAVVIMFVHIAWAAGLLPLLSGPAKADEIDTKIENKLGPLRQEVAAQRVDIQGNTAYLKELVIKSVREDLYAKFIEYCKSTGETKQRVFDEITSLQERYKELTDGGRYNQPACEDL